MKKWIFIVLVVLVVGIGISSCIKNDNPTQPVCTPVTVTAPATEVASLKAYLDSNGIVATQDSRGFFYSLDTTGSSDTSHPTACSDVLVNYRGTFLNGEVFDSTAANSPATVNIFNTISSWQEAIPLMKKNTNMTLYVPPSLGYGPSDYYQIPGNSYLIFKIELLNYN